MYLKDNSFSINMKMKKFILNIQQIALKIAQSAKISRKKIRSILKFEKQDNPFHFIFDNLKKNLFPDLDINKFTDLYVQSIVCSLFALKVIQKDRFSIDNILTKNPYFPPVLKYIFQNSFEIQGNKFYSSIIKEIILKGLIHFLNEIDIDIIIKDFERKNPEIDIITHFYEQFLRSYNPQQKTKRGIFHTPAPIVSFIVRSVDYLIQTEFNCLKGLAESFKVQILDPATGTGTFLEHVIKQIKSRFDVNHINSSLEELQKKWNIYVSQDLLPRIFGFELSIAPYIVGYLKLIELLKETGYNFSSQQKLNVFLTNALNYKDYLNESLEFRDSIPNMNHINNRKIKRQILVVIGNPPYSRLSVNKGLYIENLMNSYKEIVHNEKNIQPLSDDYIKFIRWAQELIERIGQGIIAMVTNHTYLTGIIHRGMRQELMKVFDCIYILNLHGSKIIYEDAPNGIKDENVFGIKQGICITFFLKIPKSRKKRIYHFDLFGSKEHKFEWLSKNEISTISWSDISNVIPGAPFNPEKILSNSNYYNFHSLTEIFKFYNVGGKPGDDKLLISYEPQEVINKLNNFILKANKNEDLGKITEAKQNLLRNLKDLTFDKSKIEKYNYRPFDVRWTYYDPLIWTRPVKKLKAYCRNNLMLLCSRIVKDAQFSHVFVSTLFTDVIFLSNTSSVNCYLFPLLKKEINGDVKWNLTPLYINYLKNMGIIFRNKLFIEPLAYIYAILFSNQYQFRYKEFLKRDFPRIPFIQNKKIFNKLVQLGKNLINLHLLPHKIKNFSDIKSNIISGDEIKRGFPKYEKKCIFIASGKCFSGIEKKIWEFRIGKFQICYKWLKDREGRSINTEEIIYYQKIIAILRETIKLKKEIDTIIEEI
ncbi:MAG: type ISP restriction/modification enzyme [Promethearchaeota archaeon]